MNLASFWQNAIKIQVTYSETPISRSAKGLANVFVITGFSFIGALFHTFYCYWAEKCLSSFRDLR